MFSQLEKSVLRDLWFQHLTPVSSQFCYHNINVVLYICKVISDEGSCIWCFFNNILRLSCVHSNPFHNGPNFLPSSIPQSQPTIMDDWMPSTQKHTWIHAVSFYYLIPHLSSYPCLCSDLLVCWELIQSHCSLQIIISASFSI